MILFLLAALCVVSVPLSGGKLRRLADIDLRWQWAAPLALALQVVILSIVPGGNESLHAGVHIATYVLLGAFLVANRRVPGVPVISTGALLNVLAIVANGGVMPRWERAARLAGLADGHGFHNSAVLAHPHLLWFGDIIPVPLPFPFRNVLSIGDCLIFLGMIVMLHRICGPSWRSQVRRRRDLDHTRIATIDAVLGASLTALHGVLELWQAGETPSSPPARRALGAFETCRRVAAQLPASDADLGEARRALHGLSVELSSWSAGEPLTQNRERALVNGERTLTAARSSFLLSGHLSPVAAA